MCWQVSYPNMSKLFDDLGIDTESCDMSFSVSLDQGQGCEWGNQNGLRSIFAQKSNALKPSFWRMLQEIKKFEDDVIVYLEGLDKNPDMDPTETLGQFIKIRNYSKLFQKAYLIPICASIWSCSADRVMDYSAFSVLSYCNSKNLFQLSGCPQWLTVRGRSQHYVNKLQEELVVMGCQIRTSCKVHSVSTIDKDRTLVCSDGAEDAYDGCIIAVSAPDALQMLGKEATHDEMRILGAFQYTDVYLHCDKNLMPQNPAAWSAWNFLGNTDSEMCLTYWLNVLQNIPKTNLPLLMTCNPPHLPEKFLLKWSTGQCIPSVAAMRASLELDNIQGKRGIWYCGAYHGNGFHEDGLKAGLVAAHAVLRRSFTPLTNPKQMILSWTDATARRLVVKFLKGFISAGCIILLEEGGSVLTFEGSDKRCTLKTVLRVQNPQFYRKVAAQADSGFADAYINGDVSVVDKNEGLLHFFKIILANQYLYPSTSVDDKKMLDFKGWWTPMLFTAGFASAKYFCKHVFRRNTLAAARQNIACHYDLARVKQHHEVLDIGCGWGSLAIETVRKTGCRYTGITLAKEQLKVAEHRVKEAGLQ
ncbi:Sphingolipid C9-methyltransferase, partial [Bienertia sinuspersici]